MKKRILIVNEAHLLSSGFGKIGKELLTRLHKTGKFELFELGAYLSFDDPRQFDAPWKVYPAIPSPDNKIAYQRYNSSQYGQFGQSIFEQVLLDCKVDIIFDIRDRWMTTEWQLLSPYRQFFKFILMPTIDGEPQKSEWLNDYRKVDTLLTYSQYGKDVLSREAPNLVVKDVMRPGVNCDIFSPIDKKQCRKDFGIPEDANFVIKVARNQKRKLYPDLFIAFKKYLAYCISKGNLELARKSFLIVHSSFRDVGWAFDELLIENGIGHKVLFTYTCLACKKCVLDFFQSELSICKYCNNLSLHMPNTQWGVTDEDLNRIYNCADLYIQYSICEGLGCPIAEAKATGLPAMAMTYSAQAEQVQTEVGGIPLEVGKFFKESQLETSQWRALPNTDSTAKEIYNFFMKPKEVKAKMSELALKDARDNYSFERAAKIIEKAIDDTEILDRSKTWDNPNIPLIDLDKRPQNIRNNTDYIDWLIDNLGTPIRKNDKDYRNKLIRGLNIGYLMDGHGAQRRQINHEILLKDFLNAGAEYNYWINIKNSEFIKDDTKNQVLWQTI